MQIVFETDNKGNSGIVKGEGLCFGHSAHWALLMHKTGPKRTNPELNAGRMKVSLAIHQAMEHKAVELFNKKESHLKMGPNGWSKADQAATAELAKKGTFNTYIQQAVANFKFTLKSKPSYRYIRLVSILLNSGDHTYIINIGGHWVGLSIANGIIYYFDPNKGLVASNQRTEFERFYASEMVDYSKRMANTFTEVQTPFLVTPL